MIVTLNELFLLKHQRQRLLGIDLGTKTIGIAVSDTLWSLATPLMTIHRTKLAADIHTLLTLYHDNYACGLVVGWPLNMDGTTGPRCQATKQFAVDVLKTKELPICFFDERLSTVHVEQMMIEADMSRAKRAKKVDQAAAAFILQGAIDYFTAQPLYGGPL